MFNDNDYFNRPGLLAVCKIQKKRQRQISSSMTTSTSTKHVMWLKKKSATPPIALLWLKVISLMDISVGNELLPLSMSLSASLSLPLCLPILLFLSLSLKSSFHFYYIFRCASISWIHVGESLSESVINVFEILSNLGHIFIQSRFRVG